MNDLLLVWRSLQEHRSQQQHGFYDFEGRSQVKEIDYEPAVLNYVRAQEILARHADACEMKLLLTGRFPIRTATKILSKTGI